MSKNSANLELIEKAIKLAGSMTALSNKIHVSYQTILEWKKGRKAPSALNCQKIEKATNGEVKAEEILPDYPWETVK